MKDVDKLPSELRWGRDDPPARGRRVRVFLEDIAFKWILELGGIWLVGLGEADFWWRKGHKQRLWRDKAKEWGVCLGGKEYFATHTA